MKILCLVPSLPWPPHTGGSRRSAAIIERLAARHEVSLFALAGAGGSLEATAGAPLSALKTYPYPGLEQRGRLAFWTQVLLDPLPKAVRQAVSEGALESAAAFARAVAPDAIFAEPIEMEPYLRACAEAVPGARTVLGLIDVVSRKVERESEREEGMARRLHSRREIRRFVRLERSAARRADARTCVSETDKAILERSTDREFVLAPNGVDIDYFCPEPGPVNNRALVFVGPLSFEPNRDAVDWFAREVLPLCGSVTLTVAGDPAGFSAPRGVGFAGRVDDVRGILRRSAVCVVPLRSGSGTRLKILEAFAMGKAVISTSIGAEGLDVRDGHDILLADDAESFGGAVRRVVSDPVLREALGLNGRALVEHRYRWEPSIDAIEAALGARQVVPR